MRIRGLVVGVAGGVVVACSSSSSGLSGAPLDCNWLSSQNCWKTTVAAASSCLPATSVDGGVGPGPQGKLSADGKTCTYPTGGAVVTFDSPLTFPLPDASHADWNFTVTTGSTQCMRFTQPGPQQGFTVATSAGTVSETVVGEGIQIRCPDGSEYAAQNALDLLSCTGGLSALPGDEWSSASGSGGPNDVTFLVLTGAPQGTEVFNCSQ
jgi:hypothetical protein